MASMAGSAWRAAETAFTCCGLVGVRTDELGDHLTLERVRESVAALLERHVCFLVTNAQDLRRAQLVEPLARTLAGDELSLADVCQRPDLLVGIDARVERDHRDARSHRILQGAGELIGEAERGSIPVGRLPHCLFDERTWTSGSLLAGIQTMLTPRSSAAASAPRLTTDQNVPSSEWVIMWKVRSSSVGTEAGLSGATVVPAATWPTVQAPAAQVTASAETNTLRSFSFCSPSSRVDRRYGELPERRRTSSGPHDPPRPLGQPPTDLLQCVAAL